jgi:hypothetical protein
MRFTRFLKESVIDDALKVDEPSVRRKYSEEGVKKKLDLIQKAIKELRGSSKYDDDAKDAIMADLEDKQDKWSNVDSETKPVKVAQAPPEGEEGGGEAPPEGEAEADAEAEKEEEDKAKEKEEEDAAKEEDKAKEEEDKEKEKEKKEKERMEKADKAAAKKESRLIKSKILLR